MEKYQSKLLFACSLILMLNAGIQALQSQSIRQIKSSTEYQWGIGANEDYKKADQLALDDLISKISIVFVKSENEYNFEERQGDVNDYYTSIVKTYTQTTLPQTLQIVEEKKGITTVMRYLAKEEIPKLFKLREKKIKDFTALALKAEKEFRIGDALRYSYWAYALLLSHPDHSTIEMEFEDQGKMLLEAALNEHINSIFSNLDISVSDLQLYSEEDKKNILLDISYLGQPVENLDFSYFTGQGYSNITSAKDGMGLIELFDAASHSLESIDLRIEYEYKNKSYDKELTEVLNTIQVPFFKKSKHRIHIKNTDKINMQPPPEYKSSDIVSETMNTKPFDASRYKSIVLKVIADIQNKSGEKEGAYFTEDGKEMYQKLLQYGRVTILPFDTLKVIKLENEVIVRSVPMAFSFENNNRRFIENVVFTFNKDIKIDALSFALSDIGLNDILKRSERFGTVEDKYQLIRFMEYYKTAYSLERLDYIKSIFAENALIIVGKVLHVAEPIDGMYKRLGNTKVEYIRLSKEEYMGRLANAFNSNEYINICFEENKVKKVNGDDKIYGIQIAQHYFSTNYSDFGYLFLMIDLNDSLNPKIYVRTWQPAKNEDGSVFGLGDFYFN
ncbi:MAG: hypothetical protein R2764_01245 [Bacteroidales bacterium]